ncbi:hypothetical protein F4808DRAFT_20161 [Astrocystis sublimbata]|nr:hypothetical protein F4808DRAFT_20161 [Astrocystis sublimbata]
MIMVIMVANRIAVAPATKQSPSTYTMSSSNWSAPASGVPDGQFSGYQINSANNHTGQPHAILSSSGSRSSRKANLTPSIVNLESILNDVPHTPTPKGRAQYVKTETTTSSTRNGARNLDNGDPSSPLDTKKRYKRSKRSSGTGIQNEGGSIAYPQVQGVSSESVTGFINAQFSVPGFANIETPNLTMPSMTSAPTESSASSLLDHNMASAGNNKSNNSVASAMAEPPMSFTLSDGYDVLNPALLAHVNEQCAKSALFNTPQAIVTWHQLGMADDLFYGGIHRGRFIVNNHYVIEYHNPSREKPVGVPDHARQDRRPIMVWVERNGRPECYAVMQGNVLLPASDRMAKTPADLENALNLLDYFNHRVLTLNVDEYAKAVAPKWIDRTPEAQNQNKLLVGMTPGSDNAVWRTATAAEEASVEAQWANRYIPAAPVGGPLFGALANPSNAFGSNMDLSQMAGNPFAFGPRLGLPPVLPTPASAGTTLNPLDSYFSGSSGAFHTSSGNPTPQAGLAFFDGTHDDPNMRAPSTSAPLAPTLTATYWDSAFMGAPMHSDEAMKSPTQASSPMNSGIVAPIKVEHSDDLNMEDYMDMYDSDSSDDSMKESQDDEHHAGHSGPVNPGIQTTQALSASAVAVADDNPFHPDGLFGIADHPFLYDFGDRVDPMESSALNGAGQANGNDEPVHDDAWPSFNVRDEAW